MSRERRRPGRRSLLVVVGLLLLAAGAGVLAYQYFDEIRYGLGLIPTDYPYPTKLHPEFDAVDGGDTDADPRTTASRVPDGDRLVVPRLGINTPIGREERSALARGAWLHPGSAEPGEEGNVVLAGHRRRDVFTLLHRLREGDEILVYWEDAEYDYLVDSSREVGPDDTGILEREGRDRLTLYTCIPRFLGNKRTVVVAFPVEE